MAKLYFYGIIIVLALLIGIPMLNSISDGYKKDFGNLMDPEKIMNGSMNINPNGAPLENFVRMTPNGSKTLVNETSSFFDGVATFFTVLIVAALVIGFFYIRHQINEEAARDRRMKDFYKSSNRNYRNGRY